MKDSKKDPFWDDPDPYLIGKTQLKISPVIYNRSNPVELWIFEEKTEILKGLIKVNIIPTDLEDNSLENNNPIKDPKESLGKLICVKIVIADAKLPDNVSDSFVEYIFHGK